MPVKKLTCLICTTFTAFTHDYVFNKPNPLMQGFFLLLVIGGFSLFVQYGFPFLPNKRLGPVHVFLPFLLVLWTLFTFVVASTAPPGFVTGRNAHLLEDVYKYDGFLFVKQECSTCKTPKVARSKHCRMMGRCVEKYDHYCPWINNTVGGLNFRYFLLFVFSTMVFLVYGTYVFYNLIFHLIEKDKLWDVKFMNSATNEIVSADWKIILQFMLASHGMLMFLFVLCFVMGGTLIAFFSYQLYMVKCGTTSNEAGKWADVKDFYSSNKWKREQEIRGPDYISDAQLLSENAAPLAERMVKDFPTNIPPNIYNQGFWTNLKDVIWPESEKQRRLWVKNQKENVSAVKPQQQPATTAPGEKLGGSNTQQPVSSSAKKSGKKGNKKKD